MLPEIFSNPIVEAIIVAIPSFTLGFLIYRHSIKVDKVTEQSGIVSAQTAGVNQVITGLNSLIDNLQIDNKTLRESLTSLSLRLKEITDDNKALKLEIDALNKTYGVPK